MPNDASVLPSRTDAIVGVLDSGVGGLSIVRELRMMIPAHPLLYVADQAHLPYGPRPKAEIFGFVDVIVQMLMARGAQVIVLACNAASAASLYDLRAKYPGFPFVGIEPAVKPAAEATRTGVIGVLTTQATAAGDLFRQTVARYAGHVRVITQVAPELVQLVEAGTWDTPDGRAVIARHLTPLLEAGADQIALACTHFPFLIDALRAVAGEGVTFVDPAPAVARQTRRVLEQAALYRAERSAVVDHFFTTGSVETFRAMIGRLLGESPQVDPIMWHLDASLTQSDT